MSGNWLEVMKAAISEVLETMYFTEASFEDPDSIPESFGGWRARIHVSRVDAQEVFTLSLWLRPTFAQELAGNMLGMEVEEMSPEDIRDAMGELVNMVAGSWINRLGPEAWRLGLPEAQSVECGVSDVRNTFEILSYGDPVGFAAVRPANSRP